VADDRVILTRTGAKLVASCPPALQGLIEIRGLGIMRVEADAETELAFVADLTNKGAIDRIPEPKRCELMGVELPLFTLRAFEASALAKLRFALLAVNEPERLLR